MKYTKLGNSGLEVSRLSLGCMSFGEPERGMNQWTLPLEPSRAIVYHALDLGINFFDTANQYSNGSGEEILGQILKDAIAEGKTTREALVVATKAYYAMYDGPNAKGLSRKSILHEVEQSLERLQMDYIDLYIIHRLDHDTPMEEIMKALHDLVESGKVRYIGASSMYAWQFLKMQKIAEENGWTKFISMQNLQNLLYREEEREMNPLCRDLGVGTTPWSPLSNGRLVKGLGEVSSRFGTIETPTTDRERADVEIIKRVAEVAQNKNVTRTQVALAWLLSKDYVASPIVGATKKHYLDDAVGALEVTLTDEEIAYLEALYEVRPPAFFR